MERMVQDSNNTVATNLVSTSFWQELKSLCLLILLALSIRVLVFEPFHIPSGSMRNTLIEGDYIFSTKYDYGYSRHSFVISTSFFSGRIWGGLPKRGDVVIFRPPHMMETRYIKRLVALPGEKVELKDGIVYINDKALKREHIKSYVENGINFEDYHEILPDGKKYVVRQIKNQNLEAGPAGDLRKVNNFGPIIIPNDHYFFLGDNRDQSGDSRFILGTVPFENFISKARFVLCSFGENLFLENPFALAQFTQIWKWLTSFKTERFFYNF